MKESVLLPFPRARMYTHRAPYPPSLPPALPTLSPPIHPSSSLHVLQVRVCACYLIDATFAADPAKFISGSLLSLSAMVKIRGILSRNANSFLEGRGGS
jgi:hypothetical protein